MSCAYCNSILFETRDHVIPRSYTDNNSFDQKYTVPCCKECNSMLSNSAHHFIEDRAAFLYTRYFKKYRKELKAPDWTKDELDALSPTFRKQIEDKQSIKNLINEKLLNLRRLGRDLLDD